MEKFRTALNKALELLAGLSMAVMVILTTYQVIARYIFNSPSTWSEELVGYLFGWSTLFGATIVSGERGHMNIPILVDRMNPGMRKAFHILWDPGIPTQNYFSPFFPGTCLQPSCIGRNKLHDIQRGKIISGIPADSSPDTRN